LIIFSVIVVAVACIFGGAFGLEESCRHPNMIAITIDDGPVFGVTDITLNVLKKQKVKATFFVVGQQLKYPNNVNILKRADKEGHIIGSHTFFHRDLTTLSDTEIVKEMNFTSDAIFAAISKRPKLMRPPYGAINDRSRALITAMGYQIVGWNIDANDWNSSQKASGVLSTVKAQLSKQKAGIVLLHDLHAQTYQALPGMVKLFKDNKSKIVTLDKCVDAKEVYFKNYVAMDPNNPKNPLDAQTPVVNSDGTPVLDENGNVVVTGMECAAEFGYRPVNEKIVFQFCASVLIVAFGIFIA